MTTAKMTFLLGYKLLVNGKWYVGGGGGAGGAGGGKKTKICCT